MTDNKNDVIIVDISTLDNIIISYALLNDERRLLSALIGHPLDGHTGIVQVSAEEFIAYKKHAVSNNAVIYLFSLININGELLDVEAFLLRAVDEEGSTVVYLNDLNERGTERFELF